MKVNIDDIQQAISHLFLNDAKVCELVVDTKEWTEDGIIDCQVSFNGVKVDGSVLENTLQHFVDTIEKHFKEKYDSDRLDVVIEERAKELLKEHADNALEKLYDLTRKLEESDDLLVPHWDRNKK